MKPHPKIIDRILEGIREQPKPFVSSAISGPMAIASARNSASPWPCRTKARRSFAGTRIRSRKSMRSSIRDHVIQKPKAGQKFDCVIATDAASFERWARSDRASPSASCSSTSIITRATPVTRISIGFPPANLPLANSFSLAESGEMADHQTDCRLPVHRGFDRYRFLPISNHAARHLSRRRRTGAPWRGSREDL